MTRTGDQMSGDQDLVGFGFDHPDEAWMDRLREAELPAPMGVIGAYTLSGELGRGGQAVVYRARQPGLRREIALKRVSAGAFASPRARRRFEREIETVASLNHPGIVTAYAADVVGGVPLLAMELVEGMPITRWAQERGPREIAALFAEVCDAVQYAHGRGVIHRDLKPSNILVATQEGTARPKVLDFGLASLADPEDGVPTGTPAYASPEQAAGVSADVRSDVYSLGVVLAEALIGMRPVRGKGGDGGDPLARIISRRLRAIVSKQTAPDPDARYQTMSELAKDLRRFVAGEPVSALPASAAQSALALARRHTAATAAAATLLAAIVGFGIWAGVLARQLERERRSAVSARDREVTARGTADRIGSFMRGVLVMAEPGYGGTAEVKLRDVLEGASRAVDGSLSNNAEAAARVRQTLGIAMYGQGRFAEAAREFRRSLPYFRENPGEQSVELVEALRYLGTTLTLLEQDTEADALCVEALDLARLIRGEDRSALATALFDVARTRLNLGKLDDAARFEREAIEVFERDGAGRSSKAAIAQDVLGAILLAKGDPAGAVEARRKAVEANALHGETGNYAVSLSHLGEAQLAAGMADEAGESLRKAMELQQRIYGAGHPIVKETAELIRGWRTQSGGGK